jgi:hypothetical protein
MLQIILYVRALRFVAFFSYRPYILGALRDFSNTRLAYPGLVVNDSS